VDRSSDRATEYLCGLLRLHGEGIQHIAVPVDDLEKASAAYEKLGYGGWQSGAWGDVGKAHSGPVQVHGYEFDWWSWCGTDSCLLRLVLQLLDS
jgi:hypothetical protein